MKFGIEKCYNADNEKRGKRNNGKKTRKGYEHLDKKKITSTGHRIDNIRTNREKNQQKTWKI